VLRWNKGKSLERGFHGIRVQRGNKGGLPRSLKVSWHGGACFGVRGMLTWADQKDKTGREGNSGGCALSDRELQTATESSIRGGGRVEKGNAS